MFHFPPLIPNRSHSRQLFHAENLTLGISHWFIPLCCVVMYDLFGHVVLFLLRRRIWCRGVELSGCTGGHSWSVLDFLL